MWLIFGSSLEKVGAYDSGGMKSTPSLLKKRYDPVPKELVNARHTLDYVAHQTVRGDSSHSWLSSLEKLFHLNKNVLFSSMAFLRRRPSVPSFRNNRVLQQYVLTDVTPTGKILGTGSYGSVLEVKLFSRL